MEELKEQMEAVRESGLANMFDRRAVAQAAHELGLHELEAFAWYDGKAYFELLIGEGRKIGGSWE